MSDKPYCGYESDGECRDRYICLICPRYKKQVQREAYWEAVLIVALGVFLSCVVLVGIFAGVHYFTLARV